MIIMDMNLPECCGECFLFNQKLNDCMVCCHPPVNRNSRRPHWCPIKGEAPSKTGGSLADLYIQDVYTGEIQRVGDDGHDMLTIDKHGMLHYQNLQNGDGCTLGGSAGGYRFIPNTDDYGYSFDPREVKQS